jgi:hypothetical protein
MTGSCNLSKNRIILASLFLLGFLTTLYAGAMLTKYVQRLEHDIHWYKTRYPSKSGGTVLWPGSKGKLLAYQLRSFDGGKNWYAVHDDDSGVHILGPAETIYPGLMDQIASMDELITNADKQGPLNLTNSTTVGLLEKAGVTEIARKRAMPPRRNNPNEPH